MSNALAELRQLSTIVADSGDLASIARLQPVDATTNPSLILKAARSDSAEVQEWLQQTRAMQAPAALKRYSLGARFASRIQQHVERWVSLEADATLSFDTSATIACADRLLEAVEQHGGDAQRILIKVAATWEGIRAAQVLESRGIKTNLTLIFNLSQAQLCAAGGIHLISPFVGRISDWYKAQGHTVTQADDDPGVLSVRKIQAWVKQHGYSTLVMGASFRSVEQVLALAGCDLLTVAPDLLDSLSERSAGVEAAIGRLPAEVAWPAVPDEPGFRLGLAEDAMAGEKLLEGIRRFAADQRSLDELLAA